MKYFLFALVFAFACSVVHPKVTIQNFETKSDPEYIKAEWKMNEVDGEQLLDADMYILKNIKKILYTFAFSVKEDGKYQEIFKHGPLDTCAENVKESEKFKHHHDYMKKFGNMSTDLMCPFNEGYYYLRGFKVEAPAPGKQPFELVPGEYKMDISAKFEEDGVEKQVLDQQFFMKYEK